MKVVRLGVGRRRALAAQELARELRKASTPAEQLLWEVLRDRKLLRCKFRRQFPLDGYVLDFYCLELKLVIELDGGIHAEPRQAEHDENRDTHLRSLGCTILRLPNDEVLYDPTQVRLKIADLVDELTKS